VTIPFAIIFALILDRLLGEPTRYHPLVGFGYLANKLEKTLNPLIKLSKSKMRFYGSIAVFILVTPPIAVAWHLSTISIIFDIIIIYFAIGWRSLIAHAYNVILPLRNNDIEYARKSVGMMVSRDTKNLQPDSISKACIESILENGNDSIFGVLFWYVIAGMPGVVAYRLINTLDAMWGYRNESFLHFGWSAAKLDDLINYIPARLTALSYALTGNFSTAIQCWKTQGSVWKSTNAGSVMAAGAGSLKIVLGGNEIYHGEMENRPTLGVGNKPSLTDIDQSLRLITRSIFIWLVVITGLSYVYL